MTEAGAPADGGQGGTTAAQPAVSVSTAPPSPAVEWLPEADEVTVGLVQNKGWKSPADMLSSYRQLEKFVGVPADQLVRLPGAAATKEDVDAFYGKLGRPADAKEYKIAVPQGADTAYAEWARGTFYELGLTAKQAEALAAKHSEFVSSHSQAAQDRQLADNLAQQDALKKEWGAGYEQQITQARLFAQKAGIDAPTLDKLQSSMGYDGVMRFMANLGAKLGESGFPSGGERTGFGAMTPGQAKAEINSLRADPDFNQRYLNGNKEAKDRMAQLMTWAYPE